MSREVLKYVLAAGLGWGAARAPMEKQRVAMMVEGFILNGLMD